MMRLKKMGIKEEDSKPMNYTDISLYNISGEQTTIIIFVDFLLDETQANENERKKKIGAEVTEM